MSFLSRLFRPKAPELPAPQLDEAVAQRLAREGRDPAQVAMAPAEPFEIPEKPRLTDFRGLVRFEMTVDAQGAVKAVQMDGAPFAHVAALEAWAYGWRFTPARMDGQPHACRMVFEVTW